MIATALIVTALAPLCEAILAVQKNELRSADTLDGLWTFVREQTNSKDVGMNSSWYVLDLSKFANATAMPVPVAYNDLSADADLRDHVGWVWYQKTVIVPERDMGQHIMLRFGSVNYYAKVFFNSKEIGSHVGGHLPFEFDVTELVKFGAVNKITVAVNNTLSWSTIPQGDFNYAKDTTRLIFGRNISRTPEGAFKNIGNFDFFNYAGILRSVYLLKIPPSHIVDVWIIAEHLGSFSYEVTLSQNRSNEDVIVRMLDPDGVVVYSARGLEHKGSLTTVRPWWPRGMGEPNLYTLEVELVVPREQLRLDIYRQKFGFRTVGWSNNQILINDKPFYCLGFGMHEDFEIHGRGFNRVVMTKDLNLLEWMSGNCYRTTHYPYDEERMAESDRRGIAVVVETPAVGLKGFSKENNLLHLKMLEELIARDKSHPSAIMWSLANEPKSDKKESRAYFKSLVDYAHALDKTRPVTIVYGPTSYSNDQTADLLDVICVNRYYGWYIDMGKLDWINQSVYWDIAQWSDKYKRPILVTEYGADSLPGLNQEPSVDFSEQYQNDLIIRTHHAFDALRSEHILAGEMIWNFADFMTGMTTTRAVGNHKGVFTRTRQAKMAAYTLRSRYLSLFDQTNLEIWN
ncbi:Beta-glucuronidase [Trichostrongylus colubriformis]|uniref:Beta-glucuronidase n=1 Tax=Trichostrongylus colubriformis TaxID=6319 RepID=A0AAN8IDE4_TRICO